MNTNSSVLQKINVLMPELSKQLGALRQAQADNATKISELTKKRAMLVASPITKEDYAELICIDIDRVADSYRDRIAKSLRNQAFSRVPVQISTALTVLEGKRDSAILIGKIRDPHDNDFDLEPLRQLAATFFMRDAMKKSAREAVEAIETWPFPNAKPMRETIAKINEIDKDLAALGEEKQALDSAAGSLQLGE